MSRETFLKAAVREPVDENVFGTATSIVCHDLMDEVGASFPEGHLETDKMVNLAQAGHTVLGMDVVMPLFSVSHEASAMGCNVNWGGRDMMPENGKPIFETVDDIRIPSDLLQRDGCTVPLRAISELKRRLGDDAAVCGKIFGAWTQAYHYFGVENFLMMTIDDPDITRTILERLIPIVVAFGRAQVEAGADCLLLADHATRDLCSPNAYRDFLAEMHCRMADEFDVPVILHICGNTSDRIAMIATTGVDCFHWDTKTGTPSEAREMAGNKMSLMGGISNYVLLRGTPEDVAAAARAASQGDIDIIGPECAIPLATPLANLEAIAAIGR